MISIAETLYYLSRVTWVFCGGPVMLISLIITNIIWKLMKLPGTVLLSQLLQLLAVCPGKFNLSNLKCLTYKMGIIVMIYLINYSEV